MKHCIFIDGEAGEGDNEEEEEEKEGYEYDLPSAHPRKVTTLPGPSAKHTLSKKIDEIFNAYDAQACASKPSGSLGCIPYRASWSSNATDSRMYLLDVHSMFNLNCVTFDSLFGRNCHVLCSRTPSK